MKQITIIVPIYNGQNYIENLVKQFENQTFKNFEVVFVNDGSTDKTNEKLQMIQKENRNFSFSIISQENKGVSAARNAGLSCVNSEYVCFVDADDRIPNNFLEILLSACVTQNASIAMGQTYHDEFLIEKKQDYKVTTQKKIDMLNEYLFGKARYSICATLFKSSLFLQDNLFFPEGYKYSEDVFIMWQMLAKVEKVALVEGPLYYYFKNPNSVMNKPLSTERKHAIELMHRLEPIIKKSSPDFFPIFSQYAVARHHWSILWQAAKSFQSYKSFKSYCNNFEMRSELKKLYTYPDKKIVISSKLYCCAPLLYYYLMRMYFKTISIHH